MNNVTISTWEVDAQPIDGGFASYITVEIECEGYIIKGSIQEDCGSYVEFIGEDDFYSLDCSVTEYILAKALDDIKDAQQDWKDELFSERLIEHTEYELIAEVANLITITAAEEIELIQAQKVAQALVDCSDDDFSVCDAMISLQVQFGVSHSESSYICSTARKY